MAAPNTDFISLAPVMTLAAAPRGKRQYRYPVSIGFCQPYV
jgi:hypothetical protein